MYGMSEYLMLWHEVERARLYRQAVEEDKRLSPTEKPRSRKAIHPRRQLTRGGDGYTPSPN